MTGEELDIIEVDAAPHPVNLFGARDPVEVVARSSEVANALTDVIRKRGLFKNIGAKPHVLVEGWTLLGSMMGVFPVVVWTKPFEHPNGEVYGWEARVEARTLAGQVVGAAEAECMRSEKEWGPNPTRGKMRDDYALRSMAQTRATSKALRGPLGFIVHLAGFSATPAEEMAGDAGGAPQSPPSSEPDEPISNKRHGEIAMKIKALEEGGYPPPEPHADWTAASRALAFNRFGKKSRRDLTEAEGVELVKLLQAQLDDIPFG